MIRKFSLSNFDELKKLLKKRKTTNYQLEEEVREILASVKEKGDLYLFMFKEQKLVKSLLKKD